MHYYPSTIVAAVPVAPQETGEELKKMGVEFIAVNSEEGFLGSIGAYYQDFYPVEDEDVVRIMKEAGSDGRIPIPAV